MSETNMKYYSVGDGCAMPVYEVERIMADEKIEINKRIIEQDKCQDVRNHHRFIQWAAKMEHHRTDNLR